MKRVKKLTAMLVTAILLMGMAAQPMLAAGGAVVSDSATFDVFMNVDPAYGVNANVLAGKVGGYLDQLIGSEEKNYRILTSAATIDPTDLTKWDVYDHYDNAWYDSESAWKANYDGRNVVSGEVLPENWFYYGVADSRYNASTNGKTTIEEMLNAGSGKTWGKVAQLREHIYTMVENGKPAMQFYGYGDQPFADFLYYPASTTSEKTVKFDVDATNVRPHSMSYAGFLINAGTTGSGSSAVMSGYLLVFAYTPEGSNDPATGLSNIYLVNLNDYIVNKLHSSGITPSFATTGQTAIAHPFYANSHVELIITATTLTATIQEVDGSGNLTGNATKLFDNVILTDTNFGGFGPYVQYSSHDCENTSSFRFSNLEMSFAEKITGSSPLETYQYTNYLDQGENRFYINLTNKDETNYADSATDLDKAYLNGIQTDHAVLITDEGGSATAIFPETYLGANTKNAMNPADVSNQDLADAGLAPGADDTEQLAAKLAWLIYHTTWQESESTPVVPDNVTVAKLLLMVSPVGTAGNKEVNSIYRELMEGQSLKVYPDPSQSVKAEGKTAVYTLTKPDGTAVPLTLQADPSGDAYFEVDQTAAWPAGEYAVTLQHTPLTGETCIPNTTKFTIRTDQTKPAPSASIQGLTADFSFANTPSAGNYSYTSDLVSYAWLVNGSPAEPSTPPSVFTDLGAGTVEVSNVNLGDALPAGANYLHLYVKDAAGNIGYTSKAFTVNPPIVSFTDDMSSVTDQQPYEGTEISLNSVAGTYALASLKISNDNGVNWTEITTPASPYLYPLPTGAYQLQVKAVDAAGNESSVLTLPVNAKKYQVLSGTTSYTLELGVDIEQQMDFTVSSQPDLAPGESLGAITYQEASDPNDVVSVTSDGVVSVNRLGAAILTVGAMETDTHRAAQGSITVNVINPLQVSLGEAAVEGGISLTPAYAEGAYGIQGGTLQYRKTGTDAWISIDGWNWNSESVLLYENLEFATEYEIQLTADDNRPGTPRTAMATATFRTPEEAPSIVTSTLPNGGKGINYSQSITANGTAPFAWSVVGGDLPDGLNLDPDTGYVYGTPSVSGSFAFTVQAPNDSGDDQKEITLYIAEPPLIVTDAVADGTKGKNYNQLIAASGDAPITWSISGGNGDTGISGVPDGLKIDPSTGVISGIPNVGGVYDISVTASNAVGSDSRQYTIFIASPPRIETDQLPDGVRGSVYEQTLTASGDTGITWAIEEGTLPEGLALNPDTGKISGTPSAPGIYTFTVRASNDSGSESKILSIVIADPPLITADQVSSGIKGMAYSQILAASGDSPMTWTLEDGALPEGLTLNPNTGTIAGTPLKPGNFRFTVKAANAVGEDRKEYTMTVADPPAITTETLGSGISGTEYEQTLTATGDSPMKWAIRSGSLPDGLSLDANSGKISGTPTKSGSYTFTVAAENSVGSAEREIILVIAQPPVVVKNPENQTVKSGKTITLKADVQGDGPMTYQWQVNKGNGWEDISGATGQDLTLTASKDNNGWQYRCVAVNAAGTVVTEPATIQVKGTASGSSSPKTGDTTNLMMWSGLIILSAAALTGVFLVRKREK